MPSVISPLQAAQDLQERTQHLRQRNAAVSQENHMSALVTHRQLTYITLPSFIPRTSLYTPVTKRIQTAYQSLPQQLRL